MFKHTSIHKHSYCLIRLHIITIISTIGKETHFYDTCTCINLTYMPVYFVSSKTLIFN